MKNQSMNQVTSVYPVVFNVENRQVNLEVKITAPTYGDNLSIIILSHGHGGANFISSFRGYAPLADYYASNGFVVIQPTHQDSRTLSLDPTGPEGALFWKSRAEDMLFIVDHLEEILLYIPDLLSRTNKENIAAVGHSLGAHTVSILAGMKVNDPVSGKIFAMEEHRIKAFVLFGAPGDGSDAAGWAREHYPIITGTNFSEMKRDALVVTGDRDKHPYFSERDDWRMDAYYKSPSPKTLLTITDSGHMLGGIAGYDIAETDDENPARAHFIEQMTTVYIHSKLKGDNSWQELISTFNENPFGKIDVK